MAEPYRTDSVMSVQARAGQARKAKGRKWNSNKGMAGFMKGGAGQGSHVRAGFGRDWEVRS